MSIFTATDAVFRGLIGVLRLAMTKGEHESAAERILNRMHSDLDDRIAGLMPVVGDRFGAQRHRRRKETRARPRLPSPSRGLLRLAERRLPDSMGEPERERWAEEMRADVASLPRHRRLWVAFNVWRKGAPGMPVGSEHAPRSAD